MGCHTVQGQCWQEETGEKPFSEERKKRESCSSQSHCGCTGPTSWQGGVITSFPLLVFRAQDNSAPAGRQSCLGRGLCRSEKGLLSGIIMKKKKGKDLYFFFGSFILGLILNLQKSCGNGIEFPYVFHSASHDTIILCGHGTFIKANPIMLLTSVQSLFKFYQFFTNVFFSVQGLSRVARCISLSYLLSFIQSVDYSLFRIYPG